MVSRFSHKPFNFGPSVVCQVYSSLADLVRKLENGSLSVNDIGSSPESFEYDDPSVVDMTKDSSRVLDKMEVAAEKNLIADTVQPVKPDSEPIDGGEIVEDTSIPSEA